MFSDKDDLTFKDAERQKQIDELKTLFENKNEVSVDCLTETDIKAIKLNAGYRSTVLSIFQLLFTFSFIHMDKMPMHIEGIVGIIVLWLSTTFNKTKSPQAEWSYNLTLGSLLFDSIIHAGSLDSILLLVAAGLFVKQKAEHNELESRDNYEKLNSDVRIGGVIMFIMSLMVFF